MSIVPDLITKIFLLMRQCGLLSLSTQDDVTLDWWKTLTLFVSVHWDWPLPVWSFKCSQSDHRSGVNSESHTAWSVFEGRENLDNSKHHVTKFDHQTQWPHPYLYYSIDVVFDNTITHSLSYQWRSEVIC